MGGGAWVLMLDKVDDLSRRLLACSDALAAQASAVGLGVAVPEDEHGLEGRMRELDRAAGALDRRLADACRQAGLRLGELVLEAATADRANPVFVHLPEAGM